MGRNLGAPATIMHVSHVSVKEGCCMGWYTTVGGFNPCPMEQRLQELGTICIVGICLLECLQGVPKAGRAEQEGGQRVCQQ
jgi:hypothetical protein